MNGSSTLLLTRADVVKLLDYDTCINAVEKAFKSHAAGHTLPSGILGTHAPDGGFHVKTAGLVSEKLYYAAKINANFPGNPQRYGLPTIQGVISLFDATNGRLLALIDSIEITSIRTAAATAVAAKHLARRDPQLVMIIGCGNQGRSHLRALSRVREVNHVIAYDVDPSAAPLFAHEMSEELGIRIQACPSYRDESPRCDIIVTCTTSRGSLLFPRDVSPGAFIAAVGADNEAKQEIAPELLASSTVVADVLDQCVAIGDLHHAIEAGVMKREDVHAELADVVSGKAAGRTSSDEIIVFDSTGTALEDVAAASVAYERALINGTGMEVMLGS